MRATILCDCDEPLEVRVCRANAGYYIGYWCPNDGLYSQISGYFRSEKAAQLYLDWMDSETNLSYLEWIGTNEATTS